MVLKNHEPFAEGSTERNKLFPFFTEGKTRLTSVSTQRPARSVIPSTSQASFHSRQYYITDGGHLERLRAPQSVWLWLKPAAASAAKSAHKGLRHVCACSFLLQSLDFYSTSQFHLTFVSLVLPAPTPRKTKGRKHFFPYLKYASCMVSSPHGAFQHRCMHLVLCPAFRVAAVKAK